MSSSPLTGQFDRRSCHPRLSNAHIHRSSSLLIDRWAPCSSGTSCGRRACFPPGRTMSTPRPQSSSAIRLSSVVALGLSVITCGQRRQAFRPSCLNQRQVERIWQAGRALTTGAKPSTILWTSVHAFSLKCLQPFVAQGAAMRKTSVGFAGPESARSFSETGSVSVR